MTMMDKLKFWKKEDELPPLDLSSNAMEQPQNNTQPDPFAQSTPQADPFAQTSDPFANPAPPSQATQGFQAQEPAEPFTPSFQRDYQQTPPVAQPPQTDNKDLQIILAKLDAIKASVEHLSTRVENIEKSKRW